MKENLLFFIKVKEKNDMIKLRLINFFENKNIVKLNWYVDGMN